MFRQTVTYPLMIKMLHLLTEHEVLKKRWAPFASTQTLLVFNWTANIARQISVFVIQIELFEEALV